MNGWGLNFEADLYGQICDEPPRAVVDKKLQPFVNIFWVQIVIITVLWSKDYINNKDLKKGKANLFFDINQFSTIDPVLEQLACLQRGVTFYTCLLLVKIIP